MKAKKRRYRKGLRGFWLDGTPVYRVPVLNQPKIKLTEEERVKYDNILLTKKHKQRSSLIGIKKGDNVILKSGDVYAVIQTTRWYIFLDNGLKYRRDSGTAVVDSDYYYSFIVRKV